MGRDEDGGLFVDDRSGGRSFTIPGLSGHII